MRTWTTPEGLAFEDVQTGDGRIYVADSFQWDPQPNGWPLRADLEDDGAHAGAVLIGAIDNMTRADGGRITGTGWMDDESPAGADVARMLDNGSPLGVSVDCDNMEVEVVATDVEEEDGLVVLASSFPTGRLTFDPDGTLHSADIPGFRGVLASAGLVAAAGDGDPEDGVVVFTDSMDSWITRVLRARIRGATLVDIPAFHRAAIVLDTVTAVETDPEADTAAAGTTAAVHVISEPPPCETCPDSLAAASATLLAPFTAPTRPPRSWFDDPNFSDDDVVEVEDPQTGAALRGVPMQYLTSGQVLGHIALWGQCHTGSPDGQCVLTPRSAASYRWFHHGHIQTDDGALIPTGNLTIGGGHADVRLSYRAALSHYDDASTQAAQLRAGEDRYGVWVAGAGMPDRWGDELEMRRLRAASPSGDWRWIGGSLELAHTHAVNGPGYPVPRANVAAGGQVMGLVAAGLRQIVALNHAATAPSRDDLARMMTDAVAAGIAQHEETTARRAAQARLQAHGRTAALRRLNR